MKSSDKQNKALRKPTRAALNAAFEEERNLDWASIDRQINKDTATWKRVQAIFGVPRSQETKQKISDALKGRTVPATTRKRISASLRKYHENRKREAADGQTTPPSSASVHRVASTTWPRSVRAFAALFQRQPPGESQDGRVGRRNP